MIQKKIRKNKFNIIVLCVILLFTNSVQVFALDLNLLHKNNNITQEQILEYYNTNNINEYPQQYQEEGITLKDFIDLVLQESIYYEVNPEIVFKDIMNRTNWFDKNNLEMIRNYNFSGIKNDENQLIKFNSIKEGIKSNIQLLLKYSDKDISDNLIVSEIVEWINSDEYIKHIQQSEEIEQTKLETKPETIIREQSINEDLKTISTSINFLNIEGTNYTNSKLTITANGTSDNGVLYQFWAKDKSTGNWKVLKDYSEENSATWIPEKSGNYLYGVHIKDKNSDERLDAHLYKDITINTKPTSINEVTIEGTNYTNSKLTITANGTSDNGVLYQFWVKDLSTMKWTMLKDYSEENSATWIPEKSGNYLYGVHVKDKNSLENVDVHLYKDIKVESLPPANLLELKIEGINYTNSKLTITANGTSENGVLYQFWRKDKSTGNWKVLKDYSEENSATWIPEKSGNYLYGVHIKDKNSDERLDAHLYKDITINTKPTSINEVTIEGTNYTNSKLTITANGTSDNGVLYQFWVKDLSTMKWTMLKDYSEENSATWIPEKSGNYLYGVHVKDKNSLENVDVHLYKDIKIGSLPPANLLELNINELEGQSLYRISATGTSVNGVLYQFWVKDLSTMKWTMIKDYSQENVAIWNPQKTGNYLYGVHIKDKNSDKILDAHLYKEFRVNTIISYSDYNYTLEEALSIQMSKSPQTDYDGYGWSNADKEDVKNFLDPNTFNKITLDSVKIITGPLNFRTTPEVKDNNKITTLWEGNVYTQLEEKNGWHKIIAKGRIGWVHGGYVQKLKIENDQIFQFLDLSKSAGVNESDISSLLSTKGDLKYHASTFINAGKINNINEIYLISHALLETGQGKSHWVTGVKVDSKGRIFDESTGNLVDSRGRLIDSKGNFIRGVDKRLIDSKGRLIDLQGRLIDEEGYLLDKYGNSTSIKSQSSYIGIAPYKAEGQITTVYNMFGIGAYDSDPKRFGAKRAFDEGWTSIEKAILGGAKFVSTYYVNNPNGRQNTLYEMRWNPSRPGTHQYATDIGWAYKQIYYIKSLYDDLNNYTLHFDIPRYRE
ncbi:glucosaminidase domain-containing protein [Senegalia massiliensis]|uniref:glucosaminidase domain-containing protein n=1 Tax=Senegalia massiliensis TaxID=1720316 RepID=UPI0013EEFACF|nr:glucosaminidase domain-containing protein [Senegalia massiliensis]